MTSRINFSQAEWELLQKVPMETVMTMASVGSEQLRSLLETPLEISTGVRALVELTARFPGNCILEDLFDEAECEAWWLPYTEAKVSEKDFPLDRLLDMCQLVVDLLNKRAAPRESEEFRRYLMLVAEGVANAAGGPGGFLGFGRQKAHKASPEETQALKKIAAALKLPR